MNRPYQIVKVLWEVQENKGNTPGYSDKLVEKKSSDHIDRCLCFCYKKPGF